MLEDGFGERGGAAVVHVRRGRADAPQVLGQERVRRVPVARIERDRRHVVARDLVDRLGQPRPHDVPLEVAEQLDERRGRSCRARERARA